MARIIKIGLAALAVIIGTLAVSVATNGINEVHAATVTETDGVKTVTITNADLLATKLEDFTIDPKQGLDKKFRIALPDGKYIDGAVIFNDCGHQFVGDSLGDPFGIAAPSAAGAYAYNFNILFSFEHVTSITVDLRASVTGEGENTGKEAIIWLKYASLKGEFYQGLIGHSNYAELVANSRESGIYSAAYYKFEQLALSVDEESALNLSTGASGDDINIAAFQFTQSQWKYIATPGFTTSAFINSLTFTYYCD